MAHVADVKYALLSTSKPTTYIWWLQTNNPKNPIDPIAYTIPKAPNTGFLAYVLTTCDTIPNPGNIKIYQFYLLNIYLYFFIYLTKLYFYNLQKLGYIFVWTISYINNYLYIDIISSLKYILLSLIYCPHIKCGGGDFFLYLHEKIQ